MTKGATNDTITADGDGSADPIRCVDFKATATRLGGTVVYKAHLCMSDLPHAIEGVLHDVKVEVDECCSSPAVQEAIRDRDVAEELRFELGRLAVTEYLTREIRPIRWTWSVLN